MTTVSSLVWASSCCRLHTRTDFCSRRHSSAGVNSMLFGCAKCDATLTCAESYPSLDVPCHASVCFDNPITKLRAHQIEQIRPSTTGFGPAQYLTVRAQHAACEALDGTGRYCGEVYWNGERCLRLHLAHIAVADMAPEVLVSFPGVVRQQGPGYGARGSHHIKTLHPVRPHAHCLEHPHNLPVLLLRHFQKVCNDAAS